VKNKEKLCDPNPLLDNFDVAICLFNGDQKYSAKSQSKDVIVMAPPPTEKMTGQFLYPKNG